MEEQSFTPSQKRKPFALLILVIIAPLMMGALCFVGEPPSSNLKAPGGMPSFSISNGSETNFNRLKMFDENSGWATTSDAVMRTTDGGKTWVDVTPVDWEPLDQSKSNIQGIIATCFLDANHAWLAVAENMSQADINAQATAESNIAASPVPTVDAHGHSNIDTSHIPTVSRSIYVRSTVDGGKTWMTSNVLSINNLAGSSEINFINPHEGWLELAIENHSHSSGTYVGAMYHTTDGGVTWNLLMLPGLLGVPAPSVISAQQGITGMTVVSSAHCPPDSHGPRSYSYCAQDDGSTVQGCTVTPAPSILGWAGAVNTGRTLLTSTSNGINWLQDYTNVLFAPGGAPNQNDDSAFVTSPPTIFGDGRGILPVQIEANPDGNDPTHFLLHLFTIAIGPAGSYAIVDAGPTGNFDSQILSMEHTLSAPDTQHVFVVGQQYNASDGTDGNVNLYEFVNGGWQKLNAQLDATIPSPQSGVQASPFNASLANLNFISDTEGWATSGGSLYHIIIHGGSATWSLVSTATTNRKNLTNPSSAASRYTLIKRDPGKLISVPTKPQPCYTQNTTHNPKPSTSSGLPAHTLTGYWQNFKDFTNGAKPLRLTDINANYDLIAVAFANADPTKEGGVTFSVDPDLSGALGGYSDAQFTSDIASLHQQGKKVILSVGGQNGSISVDSATAATNFAHSVYSLMQKYGFDGVDIDLENGLNVTYMASALQQLSDLVPSSSSTSLIITLAPQTGDMQSTQATYFQLALRIKNILTIVNTQYYNSGTMNGCDGKVYAEGSVDFLTAQVCIQVQGGLSPSQIGLGLPASTSAAGSGYVDPSVVKSAISCLSSGQSCGSFKPSTTYAIQDVMSWSINWDASNNYNFAKTVKGG